MACELVEIVWTGGHVELLADLLVPRLILGNGQDERHRNSSLQLCMAEDGHQVISSRGRSVLT